MVSNLTEATALPEAFSMDRAYPNPFNPVTAISFDLPIDSEVYITVFNQQGRKVSILLQGNIKAGYHSIIWDANSLASGIYFLNMVAHPSDDIIYGEYISNQKLMLIK